MAYDNSKRSTAESRFDTLSAWLEWQEQLHPRSMELGLDRSRRVAERMGLLQASCPIVTVGGTNGKGSCVAMLDAILSASGYRTGVYTSPHLVDYNERVRLEGEPVADELLVDAFARIDRARGDISLTYFEFGTLAAMDIFRRKEVDVAVLEVGLGGRLDAVNLFDADVALISTVDIDHVDWLGHEREQIAREKAGIVRPHRPVVYGEPGAPAALEARAYELSAPLFRLGHEFGFEEGRGHWAWRADAVSLDAVSLDDLPAPGIPGAAQLQNAAAVLMVVELLKGRLNVPEAALRRGLAQARLAGRFDVRAGRVEHILDVAHNAQAARALAAGLRARPCAGRTLAVFAMLADKDIGGVVYAMRELVDAWYVAGLQVPRGSDGKALAQFVGNSQPVAAYDDVAAAHAAAQADAGSADRIVVFGSFYTVSEVLRGSDLT